MGHRCKVIEAFEIECQGILNAPIKGETILLTTDNKELSTEH